MTEQMNVIHPKATPGHRIAATAVDAGLNFVTFGIGWFIWSMITWNKGQTPGKSLLKVQVLDLKTGNPARWGQMCIRQSLIPLAINLSIYAELFSFYASTAFLHFTQIGIVSLSLGVILGVSIYVTDFVFLLSGNGRRLIDYWAGTSVVNISAIHGAKQE